MYSDVNEMSTIKINVLFIFITVLITWIFTKVGTNYYSTVHFKEIMSQAIITFLVILILSLSKYLAGTYKYVGLIM